jgi:hypothetical protein
MTKKTRPTFSFEDPKVQEIVETFVSQKSRRFKFVGIDEQEIAQIIRIKVWEILPRFDPDKGKSLEAFLSVSIDHKLLNVKRDNLARFIPPCKRNNCPLYDSINKSCAIGYENCAPFQNYKARMKQKVSVRSPVSYHALGWGDGINEESVEDTTVNKDEFIDRVSAIVLRKGGLELFKAYKMMLEGSKNEVSPKMRKRVRVTVKDIVDNLKSKDSN